MFKNKGIIFTLIFLMLAFLTYDLYARGRGGGGGGGRSGGRSVSRSGAASGGSFSSARSSQSANRGSYSQGSRSSQVNRSSAQQKTSSSRHNYKKDGQSASSSQGKNYQQDRQDYGKDMQSNRQDYGDNVRDDRKEYYDDHSYRYYGSGYHHYESWGSGAAFVTGLVIGATLSAAAFSSAYPSGGCVTTYIANVSYYQCGTTWYQRAYRGGNVTYIVVNQPY